MLPAFIVVGLALALAGWLLLSRCKGWRTVILNGAGGGGALSGRL